MTIPKLELPLLALCKEPFHLQNIEKQREKLQRIRAERERRTKAKEEK